MVRAKAGGGKEGVCVHRKRAREQPQTFSSPSFPNQGTTGHSPLFGYALDGFGIYGPRGEDGKMMTNAKLDKW